MSISSFPNLVLMDPITDSMNNQCPVVCNRIAKTLSETELYTHTLTPKALISTESLWVEKTSHGLFAAECER